MRVAVWSHYAGGGKVTAFVRVGTLDDAGRFPPDVHIYDMREEWPAESLERVRALRGG